MHILKPLLVRSAHKAMLHINKGVEPNLSIEDNRNFHAPVLNQDKLDELIYRMMTGSPQLSASCWYTLHISRAAYQQGLQKLREPLLVCSSAFAALAYQQHVGRELHAGLLIGTLCTSAAPHTNKGVKSCGSRCWYAAAPRSIGVPTTCGAGTSCRASCWYALHISRTAYQQGHHALHTKPRRVPTRTSE